MITSRQVCRQLAVKKGTCSNLTIRSHVHVSWPNKCILSILILLSMIMWLLENHRKKWCPRMDLKLFIKYWTLTSYNYWKFALHSKSPKALLSKLFLRYGSLPVSEASCERLFSRKRKLMTGNYSRSKQDLVSAKLIISDATKAEIDNLIQTSN